LINVTQPEESTQSFYQTEFSSLAAITLLAEPRKMVLQARVHSTVLLSDKKPRISSQNWLR